MQNIPVIAPYPENDTMPTNQGYEQREQSSPEPPPPPPKQNDALQALQRGGELERRASRRFSAYQIQKHLGTSVNGIGTIPPAQHSPIPNRGRDARESMNAVRSRRSVLQHNRTKSKNDPDGYEPSPSRLQNEVKRISETPEPEPPQPPFANRMEDDSPMIKTPEDKLVDWKLVYRDPLPNWVSGYGSAPGHGRICLLGDAAHPFLPTSAQGATQALEDGVTLAVLLRQAGKSNVKGALRAYQDIRYERVKAVQKTGETTRDMWHNTDWEKVKKDPTSIQFPREDWIFKFDAEKHAEENGLDSIRKATVAAA